MSQFNDDNNSLKFYNKYKVNQHRRPVQMQKQPEQKSECSQLSQLSTLINYPNPTEYEHQQYQYANHINPCPSPILDQHHQFPYLYMENVKHSHCGEGEGGYSQVGGGGQNEMAKIKQLQSVELRQHTDSIEVNGSQTPDLSVLKQIDELVGHILAVANGNHGDRHQLAHRLEQIDGYANHCKKLLSDILNRFEQKEKEPADQVVLIYEIPIQMQFEQDKQQLKSNAQICELNAQIERLSKQNMVLTEQINQLEFQLTNKHDIVINRIYEIPIEFELETSQKVACVLDDNQLEDSGIEMVIKTGQDETGRRGIMPGNISSCSDEVEDKLESFSFNNCVNDNSNRKQCEEQSAGQPRTAELENRQWVYVNSIYQIPIELVVDQNIIKSQKDIQTDYQPKQLRFDPTVIQFNYIQNLLSSRKKKNPQPATPTFKSDQKHEQSQIKDESMSMLTKQMQMLLQSEQTSSNEEKQEKRPRQDNEEITYKATVNEQRETEMARSDDISRQSVLFMELSNNLNSNPTNLAIPSLMSKSNNSQTSKPAQEQEEENNNQQDNSRSMEPSLINGISMIRKRQEHSQTQSNSQINDYLQVYNANVGSNQNESYESKNISANGEGMNNCNHCGISVKHPKIKGLNNRSLGNNRNNQVDYIAHIENVIEQRYSEESKSKRTTVKNININGINPDDNGDANENQKEDFMIIRRPRMNKERFKKELLFNNLGKVEERQLQLGNNLFLQKSLVIEPSKAEQGEKKKAKQRLSEHPYLNFFETSEMEQLSQMKGISKQNSQVLKDISKQEKRQPNGQQKNNKSSFEQTSILINYGTGLQLGSQSREEMQLQQIGIIQASNSDVRLNYNNRGIQNLKNEKNQVYIIDGDTSSQGSRANREMKISQMKNEKNKTFLVANAQHHEDLAENCSHLKQDAVDMTQFYELAEKLLHNQQEKSILLQKLNQSQTKMELIKKDLVTQQEKLSGIQLHYKQKLSGLLDQLNSYDEKLQGLERELQEKGTKIEEEMQKNEEKEKQLSRGQALMAKYEGEIKQLTETLKQVEKNAQSTRLKSIKQNGEKQQIIEQLRNQLTSLKQEYYLQNSTLKEELRERQTKIEQYLKEVERHQQKIESMKAEYHEMMNNLEIACREREEYLSQLELNGQGGAQKVFGWGKMESIYQSEFAKCRESFAQELESKSRRIFQLEMQNEDYSRRIRETEQVLQKVELNIRQKQQKIALLQEQLQEKRKIEMSAEIEEELNYLRKEVVTSARELEYKEKVIRKLEDNIIDIQEKIEQFQQQQIEANARLSKGRRKETSQSNGFNFQLNLNQMHNRKSIRNVFPLNLHTTTSIINTTNFGEAQLKQKEQKITELSVTVKEYEMEIEEMKTIIINYERIMLNSQKIIRDLQEQVGEYLQDAIQKQRENDALFTDNQNYETEINQMLREKIAVEIENKRMKKMIAASQKRISAIGTRLIHAAKDKLKGKDELSPNPISQNSTLKLRELRLE